MNTDDHSRILDQLHRLTGTAPWQWTLIFLANLPVCGIMAGLVLQSWALAGCGLACGMCYGVGFFFALRFPNGIQPLLTGGIAVGWSQMFPALQVASAWVAFDLAEIVLSRVGIGSPGSSSNQRSFAYGFLATQLTGTALLAASAGIGVLAHRWNRQFKPARPRS